MPFFRQAAAGFFVVACAWAFTSAASGQVAPMVAPAAAPGVPDVNPIDQPPVHRAAPPSFERPLTPEEKRQKEIDKYDPLSTSDPTKPAVSGQPDAAADQQTTGTSTTGTSTSDRKRAVPLPGSVAESSLPDPTQRPEPEVVSDGDDLSDQTYNGPAVLSRSYTLLRPLDSREAQWSWMVSSVEGYQTGLVSGASSTATASTNANSLYNTTTLRLSGRHFWKRDQLGLIYDLFYTNYTQAGAYNGVGQSINVDYAHQFTRHLTLHLIETGSISPPSSTLENPLTAPGVSVANLSLSSSPSLQLLDVRTQQFQTSANLTWQKSARLSFSMGGGYFAVDRTGLLLMGGVGYQAQSDVNYRVDSKTTIGAAYSYTDYIFAQHESVSDTHTVDLIFSRAFGRSTQLRLRAGVSRIESLGYTQVAINPVFAALIGESSTIVDDYHKTTTSDISAQFVKDFKGRKTASFSYARGVSPGNGLILTAIQESETASFSTMMFRHYLVHFTAGRTALASQAQNTGGYITNFASVGFTRALTGNASSSFSVQYSSFSITNLPGLHDQVSLSTALSWGPGPGKLW